MSAIFLVGENENPILSISRRLQESQGVTVQDLLIFFAIGAAVGTLLLVLTYAARAMGWWSRHSSWRLFYELCKVHELSFARRRLLRKLVKAHQITNQATIFLMPEKFEAAALPVHLKKKAAELEKLRSQLFGAPV
jgi:hypothetical protein